MTQYSLFGAAALTPCLDDLDGLLLAGGQWVRGGVGARLSVLVHDAWRAAALVDEFHTRGVAGLDATARAVGGTAVRTDFCAQLSPQAAKWTHGARLGLPLRFQLDAGGLRLWTIASGVGDDAGYLLTTTHDDALHAAAGATLARLGVVAVSLSSRGTASAAGRRRVPGWRVTSVRRLRRLVELVGPAPDGAPMSAWPAASGRPVGDAGRRTGPHTVG